MNKKEAAEILGVSTRAVERYAEKGRLSVKLQKGKRGDEAIYVQEEVERLKAELDRRRNRARQTAIVPEQNEDIQNRLISSIEIQATGSKLLLTVADCERLTGLSEDFLNEAITSGKLKAQILEGVQRIRRFDLESFIGGISGERERKAVNPRAKRISN